MNGGTKFKLGEKVRMVPNIAEAFKRLEAQCKNYVGYVPPMNKFSNKVVTITEVRKRSNYNSYCIAEDNGRFAWQEELFMELTTALEIE